MNIIVAISKFPRKKASRVGDINLVGYPDILLRIQNADSLKVKRENDCSFIFLMKVLKFLPGNCQ